MIKLSLLIALICALGFASDKLSDPIVAPLSVNARYARQHTATHYLHVVTISNDIHCSSVAIGKHVLLTAAHCELPTNKMVVDSEPVEIKHIERDEHDHSLLFVAGVLFTNTVDISDRPLAMGDDVYIFGNPFDFTDLLRKGYCMGHDVDKDGENILFSLPVGPGDSGGAIFDRHGEVAGVLSGVIHKEGMPVAIGYPMMFTASQLNQAKEF